MSASCVLIHAPSDNRQLLFNGKSPYFSCQKGAIRRIPLTVLRPSFKEAKRLYNILTQISSEPLEEIVPINKEDSITTHTYEQLPGSSRKKLGSSLNSKEIVESIIDILEDLSVSSDKESKVTVPSTPLHEAAKAGNVEEVLDLLEQGSDPCAVDERRMTPYMLATEKEVRNTFRRFMALNLDKSDWQAAKVPSPLTKEMEESQNAKQAEKDARRKARAKELKKLRKAKKKKAGEELKRAQDEEREKRAASDSKFVSCAMSKAEEALLKVIPSPVDLVADTYSALLPKGTPLEFQRILELKGLKKADQHTILEDFNKCVSGISQMPMATSAVHVIPVAATA